MEVVRYTFDGDGMAGVITSLATTWADRQRVVDEFPFALCYGSSVAQTLGIHNV